MAIRLLNIESELHSFPIQQSFFLFSDEQLEESTLSESIFLFRLQSENLINLAEPYSYTLGYIKETFDLIDLSFKTEQEGSGYKVTCTPVKPLNLSSQYCLYVSKDLSEKFINVDKTISKSNSFITVKPQKKLVSTQNLVLDIIDTSKLIDGKNLIKVRLNGNETIVDVRNGSRSVSTNDLRVIFQDAIYVSGESFNITVSAKTSIDTDLMHVIKTVDSGSILPLPAGEASVNISNEDILNFYQTVNSNAKVVSTIAYPEYVTSSGFYIELPEGYIVNDQEDIKGSIRAAFNNYILQDLRLYNKDNKYILDVEFDDFDKVLMFNIRYNSDVNETEQLIINMV